MTDNTVHFDRSAGKKRALNILEQSGSETDNDGSTFIEYDNQDNKTKYFRLCLDEAQRDFRLTWD